MCLRRVNVRMHHTYLDEDLIGQMKHLARAVHRLSALQTCSYNIAYNIFYICSNNFSIITWLEVKFL